MLGCQHCHCSTNLGVWGAVCPLGFVGSVNCALYAGSPTMTTTNTSVGRHFGPPITSCPPQKRAYPGRSVWTRLCAPHTKYSELSGWRRRQTHRQSMYEYIHLFPACPGSSATIYATTVPARRMCIALLVATAEIYATTVDQQE